ncbi:MAG: glycoside hydrolase family 27 protein, partial [Cohnella sp.]|nr:glycoside hydrolase family 27 protein [Cohnella sp.]
MDNRKLLGLTPAMGWNSWNTFTWDINEQLIRDVADVFVSEGYKEAGYEYIVIDDCWSLKERDADGNLVADPAKFPSGMKALADYIHSKGLKFGMYSCVGTHTCAGYPGSFEHEFQDARQLAEWGVDFLKYDYCFKPRNISGELMYKRMSLALKNCGRDILFSACNWGEDNVYQWIRESGAHMYRSTGDIQDNWDSVKRLAISQLDKECYTGAFCHNDMDMLIVGMHGGSNDGFIGSQSGGCSDTEYKTHFSLWSLMGSPLMIGCDIRKASQATKNTLLNPDLIAINQDIEVRGAYRIKPEPQWFHTNEVFMLVKVLTDGDLA